MTLSERIAVDDVAHHRERCACCGLELGPGRVVRLFDGECYHPICWEPPRGRPRAEEVRRLWDVCLTMAELGVIRQPRYRRLCREVAHYLDGRGLLRGCRDMIRVLPFEARCPAWARWKRRSWAATGHRLILPVYDHAGRLTLVRGWRWRPDPSPKRLAAMGDGTTRGLVLANRRGRRLLQGRVPEWYYPARVVVVEGEPDYLAAAITWPQWCVLGIASGSWTEELAGRVPAGAVVAVRTDADVAGDRYHARIEETLAGRCSVVRARDERGDINDLLLAGLLGGSPLPAAVDGATAGADEC